MVIIIVITIIITIMGTTTKNNIQKLTIIT